MSDSAGWSLTESDPGIFTGLLKELGVKGLEVEELYGLEPELLQDLHPVHALIFLFKWIGGAAGAPMDGTLAEPDVPHYFAQQVISNACATVAILNSVLNIQGEGIEVGEELGNLQAFSEGLDAESRGWTISNSEKIRAVHNSFARSDPFHLEESRKATEDDDAFHFIAYLPIGDKLYELDGLKRSPVSHGLIPGGPANWTAHARDVVNRRIATHPEGEVHFNLLAITSRSTYLAQQLVTLEAELVQKTAEDKGTDWTMQQIGEVKERLGRVEEQFKTWDTENELRRHNYVGLIHALLFELAKQDKLAPQIEKAKETMKRKIAEKKAKGQDPSDAMEE